MRFSSVAPWLLACGALVCACRDDSTGDDPATCGTSCAEAIESCTMLCAASGPSATAYAAYTTCMSASCATPCSAVMDCPLADADCEQCLHTSCASVVSSCMSQ